MNTTILNTIDELFNEKANEDRDFSFDEIFAKVESVLSEKWLKNNPKFLSKELISKNKTGETYKLLTIDGRFIRHEDGTWSKRKFNEAI
ncbi:MAG: hypothetical protein KFW07_01570 [Mycoplasmataceae bacterium]|nr:hypothetical protein [Mycoplasmataceae bacterium]